MKHILIVSLFCLISSIYTNAKEAESPAIEVTGTATMNIIPDRITVEIGMEEYYKRNASGDSTIVKLADIEQGLRSTLHKAGVSDSLIVVSDMGNYRDRSVSSDFMMAKRLSATVNDFAMIDVISDRIDRRGVTSFNITGIANSDIEQYNRQGLKAALDAARQKAEFIAANEGLTLLMPLEIVETTHEAPSFSAFTNVAYEGGAGMDNMRRIVRRYSVKVRYLFRQP